MYQKKCLTLLLIVWLTMSVLAQEEYHLPQNDPAVLQTQKVYQKIKKTIGDSSPHLPTLEIHSAEKNIAKHSGANNKIILEKKAFDICQQFGKDADAALAFLIGHELDHFYKKNNSEVEGFATTFKLQKKEYEAVKQEEYEADLFGTYIAHQAGYQVIKILPELLDKLYETYQLNENMKGYPSLEMRKGVIYDVCKKTETLKALYEAANYLSVVGEHNSAISCYSYILNTIKTKELYHNLGTNQLQAAILQLSKRHKDLRYPLIINWELPLRAPGDEDPKKLIIDAEENLKKALEFDYSAETTLSLACLYAFQKQYLKAEEQINIIQKSINYSTVKSEIQLVEGILMAKKGNTEEASLIFSKAAQSPKEFIKKIAIHNQYILQGKKIQSSSDHSGYSYVEELAGKSIFENTDFEQSVLVKKKSLSKQTFYWQKGKQHFLFAFEKIPGSFLKFYLTQNPNEQSTERIKLDSPAFLIYKEYTKGQHLISPHKDGYVIYCNYYRLIFLIDWEGKVKEWGYFSFQ